MVNSGKDVIEAFVEKLETIRQTILEDASDKTPRQLIDSGISGALSAAEDFFEFQARDAQTVEGNAIYCENLSESFFNKVNS